MLTIAECAYIAGIIDGEGCLTISKCMAAKGKSYSYRPETIVVQAPRGRALIDWLQTRIGGRVHTTKSGTLALRLAAQETRHLLDVIEPFSVIKAEQVAIMRAFYRTFDGGHLSSLVDKAPVLEAREACFQSLSALHGGSKIHKRRVW